MQFETMSALSPKADIASLPLHVRYAPKAEVNGATSTLGQVIAPVHERFEPRTRL